MSETIGILGLARSGRAAAQLALRSGARVYASDVNATPDVEAAAAEIRAAGGSADVGSHDIGKLQGCDVIVLSPGIPPTAPVLQDPAVRKVPRISELEYAARALTGSVIAITGTNGKSTTTALTAHLLTQAGFTAVAAGNIGLALSEVALREPQPQWVVVEASSFQLADIERFKPHIGMLTNLAPDHLDRYPNAEAYYADKARMFETATEDSTWVLNGDDKEVLDLAGDAPGRRYFFRTESSLSGSEEGAWLRGEELVVRMRETETVLLTTGELRIPGRHNHANALAAAVGAVAAGAPVDAVAAGLRTFGGLPHRLEHIGSIGGVAWINDSKATNIASTLVALRSMTAPTVLLLGGRHKGEPYTALLPVLQEHVHTVIAYGEAGERVAADLAEHVDVERVHGNFDEVLERARAVAKHGDVVLLSPACASYDMFRNYEERGAAFRRYVEARNG